MRALGIVDVQKDFMDFFGLPNLYVEGAEEIKTNIVTCLTTEMSKNTPIFFALDCHDINDTELNTAGGPYPPHCMQHTIGALLIDDIHNLFPQTTFPQATFTKRCHNIFDDILGDLINLEQYLGTNNITEVVLIGIVGNICIETTALGLRNRSVSVIIPEDTTVWLDLPDNKPADSRQRMIDAGVQFINSYTSL